MADSRSTQSREVSPNRETDAHDNQHDNQHDNKNRSERLCSPQSNDAGPLTVWLGSQHIGYLELPDAVNMRDLIQTTENPRSIDARLFIGSVPLAQISTPSQDQQPQSRTRATASITTSPASNDISPSRKRKAATAESEPFAKRPRTVAKDAEPVAKKPASHYATAAREPTGMTKEESDSCLTCLRYSKKCKGETIVLVNGHKRCQCCANPGTGTSGRVCYWWNPEEGIHTYEDGQRLLAKALGGRVLTKNTRAERQKRQSRAARGHSQQNSLDNDYSARVEDSADLIEEDVENEVDKDEVFNIEDSEQVGEMMQSAAESAYAVLQTMVALDLGLPPISQSNMIRLAVARALRDAFQGNGPHQEHLEGIPITVLQFIPGIVERDIAKLEAELRRERGEGGNDLPGY